jgi:hypothetical protein
MDHLFRCFTMMSCPSSSAVAGVAMTVFNTSSSVCTWVGVESAWVDVTTSQVALELSFLCGARAGVCREGASVMSFAFSGVLHCPLTFPTTGTVSCTRALTGTLTVTCTYPWTVCIRISLVTSNSAALCLCQLIWWANIMCTISLQSLGTAQFNPAACACLCTISSRRTLTNCINYPPCRERHVGAGVVHKRAKNQKTCS